MLSRLAGGAPPVAQTRKLWMTSRLLGLRIRRPRAYAGTYVPLRTDPSTVAYLRGDEVLVAVATRSAVPAGSLDGVQGRWRDVLSGEERVLESSVRLSALLDEYGIAVLERA